MPDCSLHIRAFPRRRPRGPAERNHHSPRAREHADPQGPSSPRNHHKSQNGGRQEIIGHCLIRQWPIVLDAVVVGFWPFSLTVLTTFSSPSVSPLPPPLHSEVAPSAPPRHGPGGPRARPHPGPHSPGLTWASHGLLSRILLQRSSSRDPPTGILLNRIP